MVIRSVKCPDGNTGGFLLPSDSKKCCNNYIGCAKCQGTQGDFLFSIIFFFCQKLFRTIKLLVMMFSNSCLYFTFKWSALVGKCPSSHPFLLNHGRSCCSSDSVHRESGCKTDYKRIRPEMPPECCKDENRIECAGMMCQANAEAISETICLLDRQDFSLIYLCFRDNMPGVASISLWSWTPLLHWIPTLSQMPQKGNFANNRFIGIFYI